MQENVNCFTDLRITNCNKNPWTRKLYPLGLAKNWLKFIQKSLQKMTVDFYGLVWLYRLLRARGHRAHAAGLHYRLSWACNLQASLCFLANSWPAICDSREKPPQQSRVRRHRAGGCHSLARPECPREPRKWVEQEKSKESDRRQREKKSR